MPREGYLDTKLPAGSRLPPNFKVVDFLTRSLVQLLSPKHLI
ncbi:hypothetical protein [Salinicola socius]